ncbi:MAG: CoA transferase [Alcaligenaceae bacterium]|nr:CoA transferase [Alcaligenaceae bacterium]
MKLPLEGLKILDLSHALAGPFCSTMLADYGAQVIKIEPPGKGDIARAWGTKLPGGETDYFVGLHRNKQGMVLDLKNAEGKETFLRMAERCDVVLENFRPGTLVKLGIDYEVARKRNPGIIYCSISGFGQDGPYRDRPALDLIVQAESGMISATGNEGGHGARAGVSIADLIAGMNAALGIMMALRAKDATGVGQSIDISMLEGQLSLLSTMIGDYFSTGTIAGPMGTAYKALLPYQTFRTKTQDLALAVGSDKLWLEFCPLIGCSDMTHDPRFATNSARMQNRKALIDRLQAVFLTRSFAEWETILVGAGIPMGSINNVKQVVEHPQVVARGAIVDMVHPRAGNVRVVGVPIRMSATPGSVRTPSPSLGEHTEAVLSDVLGMTANEIETLRAAGGLG